MSDELRLLMNILINFVSAFLIVRFLYYTQKQSKKYVFSF
jgi:hypothetical protein